MPPPAPTHSVPTPSAQTDVLSLTREMIAIPSLSGEEQEVADRVEAHVREAGVEVVRYEDNVAFSVGVGDRHLLLNSHLDVVPPSGCHRYDPFDPVVDDGVLYGRGSVDAKASGAAMTTALLSLAADGWRPANGRLTVALTTCEEGGGRTNGLENLRPHLPEISAAIVGEPTGLQPCVAQKGLLILKIHAHGTSAHAGRPHLGTNAIPRAMQALQALQEVTLDRSDPHLGTPTLTVTTIDGGTARNVVPDHCEFAVDIRTTPSYTHAEIIEQVEEVLAGIEGVEVEVYSNRFVPCATPTGSDLEAVCRTALPDATPFGSPTASDWIFLHDVPAVKLGPGDSRLSHTAEERIPVPELQRAVDVYRRFARHYFAE